MSGLKSDTDETDPTPALTQDECIGVFPEGTSHTEPHLIPLKDGTSWTALEYLVYLNGSPESGGPHKGKPAVIVPVGIAYCDKTKYRSRLAVTWVMERAEEEAC